MRVLIAYDGSSGAEQALALADSIRWPPDTTLRIVTVAEPGLMLAGSAMAPGTVLPPPDLAAHIDTLRGDQVSEAARRLRSADRTAEGVVLRGRPATVLVDEAARFRADLLLGGSRGHGAVSSLLLGSVFAEVVDDAPCPVLVARTPGISSVLFASDGSAPSVAAERLLSTWPLFESVPIQVVSVAHVFGAWRTGVAPTMYAEVLAEHAKDLEQAATAHTRVANDAAARLRAAGRTAEAAMRTGDPAAEIIAAAEQSHADLVVIGSRGETGLKRMVLGSVARNVLHGSAASVLVVHEANEAAAG